jgi:UDP-glucuronate 4-epimerase
VNKLIYASSSSVYGGNTRLPFSESDRVDKPVSIYAASKKSNELMAHTYSHLFGLNTIGLRFFTVYGPWGRPEMALFKFTKNILEKLPIPLYNQGQHRRSFTYIDDITESMIRLIDKIQEMGDEKGCYQIYNIGGENSVELMDYVHEIERALGKSGIYQKLPLQLGDVVATQADSNQLEDEVGYKPSTSIQDGIQEFISWYRKYYNK